MNQCCQNSECVCNNASAHQMRHHSFYTIGISTVGGLPRFDRNPPWKLSNEACLSGTRERTSYRMRLYRPTQNHHSECRRRASARHAPSLYFDSFFIRGTDLDHLSRFCTFTAHFLLSLVGWLVFLCPRVWLRVTQKYPRRVYVNFLWISEINLELWIHKSSA